MDENVGRNRNKDLVRVLYVTDSQFKVLLILEVMMENLRGNKFCTIELVSVIKLEKY